MLRLAALLAVLVNLATGCGDSEDDATAPVTTTSTTTTTAAPTTTTTTTAPTTTTTTTAPTTTALDPAPGTVGGLIVGIGGGSGEVIAEWDRNSEPDVDLYRIWYSDDPGGSKALLAEIPHDTSALPGPDYDAGGGRTAYVDLRPQIEGKHCHQVSPVDGAGQEDQRSNEACLPFVPPPTPSGFDGGIGGGSGEVMVVWNRVAAPDTSSYQLCFSEFPGGSKTLIAKVAHDPGVLVPPAYDAGGGRTACVDFPRLLEDGRNCYQISAVDTGGHESPRTGELCLSGL